MEFFYVVLALVFGALGFGALLLTLSVIRSHPAEYQKNKELTDQKFLNALLGRVLPAEAGTISHRVCNFAVIETDDDRTFRYTPAGSLSNEAVESVLLEKH